MRWVAAGLCALALAACRGERSTLAAPDAGAANGGAGHAAAVSAGTAGGERAGAGGVPAAAHGGGMGGGGAAGSAQAGAQSLDAGGAAATSCGRCAGYGVPEHVGSVQPAELDALSGLAVSRAQPGILFAHDDHDRPVVFALDVQGQLHARISLQGATASDIEDIAVGPCDADTCVYLADIGDNAAQRSTYAILRFKEPMVPDAPGSSEQSPSFERFVFDYPDGSHNAESLMVAPNGNLYIITKLAPGSGGNVKATGPSSVYKLDASRLSTSQTAHAVKVATLTIPRSGEAALSAAAAHPCGDGFLVRTYDRVYEFLVPAGSADFEQAFSATPTVVGMPDEPQSEGIDYQGGGLGFFSSGEGAHAPIYQTGCALYVSP